MPIRVKLHLPVRNARNAGQREICELAARLLESAVNRSDFLDRVRNADYIRTGWRSSRNRRIAYTPQQVAARIEAGRERKTPVDGVIDVELALRSTPPGTVGSARVGHQPIRPGYRIVNSSARTGKAGALAAHIMHEWLHVSGFYHKYRGQQDDVPYVVGRIVGRILRNHFIEEVDEELLRMVEEEDCGCFDPKDERAPVDEKVPDEEIDE